MPTLLLLAAEAQPPPTPFHWAHWTGFFILVAILLALDLGVLHRKAHEIRMREAAWMTAFWVGLAAAFNVWIYYETRNLTLTFEFTAGYLLEESLSVDNLFVFVLIFRYFSVPKQYQHRVLFWGILGAIVMRLGFILLGSALVKQFHWVLYIFAVILLITAAKLLFRKETQEDFENNRVLRLFKRFVPMVKGYHGQSLLVRIDGKLRATPLLAVLVVVETTDVIFAVDSVPAIFGVVKSMDSFIIFSSNVFAILGLRALYFLLSGLMDRFHLLKIGLALVLMFIAVKMFLDDTPLEVPIRISLPVIGAILLTSILTSLLVRPRKGPGPAPPTSGA